MYMRCGAVCVVSIYLQVHAYSEKNCTLAHKASAVHRIRDSLYYLSPHRQELIHARSATHFVINHMDMYQNIYEHICLFDTYKLYIRFIFAAGHVNS